MATYTPDRWIKVKITDMDGNSHERILASWYGGFAGSDSWKLSSGVTSVEEDDKCFRFHNTSGSIYTCYKTSVGMSSLAHSVFLNYCKQLEAEDCKMEIVEHVGEQ